MEVEKTKIGRFCNEMLFGEMRHVSSSTHGKNEQELNEKGR